MEYSYLTDPGKVRDHNEDSVTVIKNSSGEILLAVADGMGGHRGGEIASSIAISHIGKRFAEIMQRNYENIYPYPDDVDIIPTTSLAEVRRTKAPSALIEVAYHDNPEEAQWIRENINAIGKNLAQSIAQYFGVPFVEA